jgi:hypothetical protein
MSRPRSTVFCALVAALTIAGVALAGTANVSATTAESKAPFVSTMTPEEALALIEGDDGILRFDMAEDFTRLSVAGEPVHADDGLPAYGNAFITQGYLYPPGTLTEGNGVNPDGSPEFPELVLGEWTCRGWHVGDGAHTTTGPWVVTTQLYNFGGEWGTVSLASDGYELADVGVELARPIIGGTGPFAGARGEVRQTLLGFNAINGVNVRFEIVLAE